MFQGIKKAPAAAGALTYSLSDLVIGSENVNDLVSDHILNSLTSGLEILSGIEVIGMLNEVLTYVSGHCKTDIGVDIDLTYSELSGLTELILGDTDSIGHVSAVLIDHLYEFLGNGR